MKLIMYKKQKRTCKECKRLFSVVKYAYLFPSPSRCLGSSSKTTLTTATENIIWKCNFAFLQSFLNYSNQYGCKMCYDYPEIQLGLALHRKEDKIENLSSSAGHLASWKGREQLGNVTNVWDFCFCRGACFSSLFPIYYLYRQAN